MHSFIKTVAAAAAIGAIAAPAAAQYYPQTAYPQPTYPQQAYPAYAPQAYPGTAYGQYGYGQQVQSQNPIQQIIDGLLGNRYQANDRTAVTQCATAALAQAQAQYRGYNQPYGYPQQRYGNQQGYGYNQNVAVPAMRVTAISNVERRNNGLRVRGLISSGYGATAYGQGYGNAYGYQNQAAGDLSFRCNVDYRGAVTGVRVSRNNGRRY